jgi:hypothetical protein
VQQQVSEELFTAVFGGVVPLDDLLADYFLRDLHGRLYGDIWSWGGRWRQREINIGVGALAYTMRWSAPVTRHRSAQPNWRVWGGPRKHVDRCGGRGPGPGQAATALLTRKPVRDNTFDCLEPARVTAPKRISAEPDDLETMTAGRTKADAALDMAQARRWRIGILRH